MFKKRSAPSPVGTVLDRKWLLTKKLGEGGMGAVFEAENVSNGRKAAIKIMSARDAKNRFHRQRFELEGLLANRVDQATRLPLPSGPGVAPVYDTGTSTSQPYLVMDKLDGMPLDSYAELYRQHGRTIPPRVVGKIAIDTLSVLGAAHQQGIVHRDIKPPNLFMTRAGDVKVLDFGIAQVPGDRPSPGHFTGTPGAAPPEQALGLLVGPEADTYAVGATVYELLTGRPPMDPGAATSSGRTYLSALTPQARSGILLQNGPRPSLEAFPGCPIPPVRQFAPATPPRLAAVIDRSLRCEPSQRYGTAEAMRRDLEVAIEEKPRGFEEYQIKRQIAAR